MISSVCCARALSHSLSPPAGTDHGIDVEGGCGFFTCGINTVTETLNIGGFWGDFGSGNHQDVAYVDTGSPLMNFPLVASLPASTCNKASATINNIVFDHVVWDHTTTSQPAIGLQPNGMTFYAAAFHSQDTSKPAISSTMRGLINFQVAITEPECDQCFAIGATATIVVTVHVDSVGPYTGWTATHIGSGGNLLPLPTAFTVAPDGLSATITTIPFTTAGDHGFAVQVTDGAGSIATASVRVSAGGCGNPTTCESSDGMWTMYPAYSAGGPMGGGYQLENQFSFCPWYATWSPTAPCAGNPCTEVECCIPTAPSASLTRAPSGYDVLTTKAPSLSIAITKAPSSSSPPVAVTQAPANKYSWTTAPTSIASTKAPTAVTKAPSGSVTPTTSTICSPVDSDTCLQTSPGSCTHCHSSRLTHVIDPTHTLT